MSNADHSTRIPCPRCGYDQRGIVATWTDSCPLQGTCSECGLIFNWSEVLCPEKYDPPSCVEFVPSLRQVPAATIKTWARSFWPWRFWTRLKMTSQIRWGRLAVYLLLLLILPNLLVYVAIQTTAAVQVRVMQSQGIQSMGINLRQQLPLLKQRVQSIDAELKKRQEIPIDERDGTPILIDLAVLSWKVDTLEEPDAILRLYKLQFDAAIVQWEQILQTGSTVNISYARAITEAVFQPFSSTSRGTVTTNSVTTPYTAPKDLHVTIAAQTSLSFPGSDLTEHIIRSVLFLVLGLWVLLFLPVSFILLPISRRKAKVRWAHIWRVTAYSLFIPLTLVPLAGLCVAVGYAWPSHLQQMLFAGEVLIAAPFAIGLIIWWAVAIKRYLHMPNGAAISLLLSILAVLLPFVVFVMARNAIIA